MRGKQTYNSNKRIDFSLLEKLTIIIPTHNRNYYLSRCLEYHSQFPFMEIIVADSSLPNKQRINKKVIDNINERNNVSIKYIWIESDNDKYGRDIVEKWDTAVKYVNTKYSLICTDKEYYIPSTLVKCIEYLESHPDTYLCEGKYCYIERPLSGKYMIRNMYPSKTPILQNDAVSRLTMASKGKTLSCNQMGIHNSKFHKFLYNILNQNKIDDIRFGEFTLELLTIASSKTMYLNLPYCYRDICNLSTNNTLIKNESSSLRYPYLETYQKEGIYDLYFKRFVNCLAPEISKNSALTLSEAESFVNTELPKIIKKRGFYGNTKFTQDPLWYIWRHAPSFMKNLGGYIIPKKYLDYKEISTPEEKYITDIIEKTKHLHATDSPIDESILSEEMRLN